MRSDRWINQNIKSLRKQVILGKFIHTLTRANLSIAPTCGRANFLDASQIIYIPIALIKNEYLILPFCIFEIINLNHKKFKFQISNF